MTPETPDVQVRMSSDARIRAAWASYRENLVALDGTAYDHAERAEWEHLQHELREIAAECDLAVASR